MTEKGHVLHLVTYEKMVQANIQMLKDNSYSYIYVAYVSCIYIMYVYTCVLTYLHLYVSNFN